MIKPKILSWSALLIVIFTLSCWTSCNDNPTTDDDSDLVDDTLSTQSNFQQFYHAWLADCVNDVVKDSSRFWGDDPTTALLKLASKRITDAISDKDIVDAVGAETLVWGPQLVIDYDGSSNYIAKNLMYCVKSADNPEYSIGIAGTNMLSHYDWFTEDLQVATQVSWDPGGVISTGSHIGFEALNGLKDEDNTLLSFLQNVIKTEKQQVTINVAGHSLGGAMTQVYASYLKSQLQTTENSPLIQAWVYAGPTAGDRFFAQKLVEQVDAYHAFNNTLDLIPHAWQADKLAELCDIYDDQSFCDSTIVKNNSVVDGIIKYLSTVGGQAPSPYHVPGSPTSFTGAAVSLSKDDCSDFMDAIYGIWKSGDVNDIYLRMDAINQQCDNGDSVSEEKFYSFFYYLSTMGVQHTTAYFDHFFADQTQDFRNAVDKYVPGGKENFTNMDQGKLLLEDMLNMAKDTLIRNSITDCNC